MIQFRGSPKLIPIWREFFVQINTHHIEWAGQTFESKPKITDRASQKSWLEWAIDEDWIQKSSLWHDGADRSNRWIAIKNDFNFAVFVAAELKDQGIRFAKLRAFACFVAVRLGWNTGFDGSPPQKVLRRLERMISAGEVPFEMISLLCEHENEQER